MPRNFRGIFVYFKNKSSENFIGFQNTKPQQHTLQQHKHNTTTIYE